MRASQSHRSTSRQQVAAASSSPKKCSRARYDEQMVHIENAAPLGSGRTIHFPWVRYKQMPGKTDAAVL
jgi:hypothetical protein